MKNFPKIVRDAGQGGDGEDNKIIFNLKTRRIDVFCRIDRNAVLMMQSIIEELKRDKGKTKLVTMVVDTDGGLAFQGLAIYDLVKNSGLKFRTIVLGEVASAGLAVVLAGDERWMHKHASLHFHATAMQFMKPKESIEQHEEDIQRGQKRVINRLYYEITMANSNLTNAQIRRLERNEICTTAEQALKFGLIHKII